MQLKKLNREGGGEGGVDKEALLENELRISIGTTIENSKHTQ